MTKDPHFKVHLLAKTELQPEVLQHLGANGLAWLAAHRCYSEELSIVDNPPKYLPETEEEAGEKLLGKILKPGHFGTLEHFHMTFEAVGFPHDVMAQHRTHRVGTSFAVQSQRYTSERVIGLVKHFNSLDPESQEQLESACSPYEDTDCFIRELEKVFYSRPVGEYTARDGKRFIITNQTRLDDLMSDFETARMYYHRVVNLGFSEETARNRLAQSVRQGYIFTLNSRSHFHQSDLRLPKNAQWEIRQLFSLLFEQVKKVSPEQTDWYEKNRLGKNKLSP